MSVIHEERGVVMNARLLLFPLVIVTAMVVFLLRLWDLQVVQSEELRLRAERMRSTSVLTTAPRGLIVDRKGRLLAAVRSQYVVTGIPRILNKNPEMIRRVAVALGVPEKELADNLADGNWRPGLPTPIFKGATSAQATRIVEDLSLEGVNVITQPTRHYVEPMMMTHVLGYVRSPDERDVNRFREGGREAPEYVGKSGLEKTHDLALSGDPGREEMTIDSRNRPLRTQELSNPRPGSRLALGLDVALQRYAYELLGDRTGSIVALDPRTGLVLCYVSKPSYDANIWLGGLSQSDYQKLLNDPNKPLIDRTANTGYMPGSTFKIVTALAAELAGQFSTQRRVYCPGFYKLGSRRIRCLGNHGSISFNRAFEKSCNTYFIALGMGAGPERLAEASRLLGLGDRTGIDLPSESTGIVPSAEWKRRRAEGLIKNIQRSTRLSESERRDRLRAAQWEAQWYPGDTANFSIGQGFVNATPLQLAAMAANVGMHGRGYVPQFVAQITNPDGTISGLQPQLVQQANVPAAFWQALDTAMVATVESGTARAGRIAGLQWGGKTGSAQNSRGKTADSLFVGVAPVPNPRVAIAVVVENSGHGGEVAAPIAGKIVQWIVNGPPKPLEPPAGLQASR